MSYDLYLKPRTGAVDQRKIFAYFSLRQNCEVNPPQVWYKNEDTGVYFVFEMRNEKEAEETENYPIAININYIRPSYFIMEAEPQITAFIREFDMVVSDPQMHGMGEAEYDAELLKSGWNHGNDFACSAVLRDPKNRSKTLSLPSATLLKAWSWNLTRQRLQNDLGEAKFVPRVMFILLDGAVRTVAVWPDGIPIAVPDVDYLVVPRKQLARRQLFWRVEDTAVVALKDALPMLQKHGRSDAHGTLILDYSTPKGEIAKYVTSLPANKHALEGLPADQVIDRELLVKYAG